MKAPHQKSRDSPSWAPFWRTVAKTVLKYEFSAEVPTESATNIIFPHTENLSIGFGLILANTTIKPVSKDDNKVKKESDQSRVGCNKRGKKQTIGEAIWESVNAKWYVACEYGKAA